MEEPRQWIKPRLKEDPKKLDLVECFFACYHSLTQKVISRSVISLDLRRGLKKERFKKAD